MFDHGRESHVSAKIGLFTEAVNGQVTVTCGLMDRSSYRQMTEIAEILRRIDARKPTLKLLGLSTADSAISKRAGMSDSTIRNWRRATKGERKAAGVNSATIAKLADALRTTPSYLMGQEDDPEPNDEGERTVKLVGYVGAGSEAHFYAFGHDGYDEVLAPADATPNTVGVEIRGDSLGALFNRWIAFYDDVRSPVTEDLFGQVCVVGLEDGRVVIKKLQRRKDGGFDLVSERGPPIENAAVTWAAKVIAMTQRR